MPRQARIALAGWPHHVVQRGHNRRPVFRSQADYRSYLDSLNELRERLSVRIYAWCLMTNHVHLVVEPSDRAHLSVLMKHLAARHTRRMNRILQRSGTSWEGRFKCSLIDTDTYLLACLRYVELNPVRAGLVMRPEEYPWSSYYLRMGIADGYGPDGDPAYLALGSTQECRRRRYAEFVACKESEDDLEVLRVALRRNQVAGMERSVVQAERQLGRPISRRGPGRPRKKDSDLFS